MSLTQGSQPGPTQSTSAVKPTGQWVKACRRLAAGEARRGGVLRDLPTGLHFLRGKQLRAAGARPHPAVVMAWPGSGRSIAGDELGGGQDSGVLVAAVA